MALRPYFDPLGETESGTTVYTLTAFILPRPQPKWLPSIFPRQPFWHPNSGFKYKLPASAPNPNYDCFEFKDFDDMPKETRKVRSNWFLADIRCAHVQGVGHGGKKVCHRIFIQIYT
jgi:hypothetical protein